jgi:hypothetical protein
MEMGEEQARATTAAANNLLLNVAIRSLMRSHPDQAALRAAWDQAISEMGGAMLAGYAGSTANTSAIAEEFQRQKTAMEKHLPPAR